MPGHAVRSYYVCYCSSMNETVRVFVGSDFHCGSLSGLTPPSYDAEPADTESALFSIWRERREFYNRFAHEVERFQPFDIAIFNGDLIDGDQSRSKGQELLEPDRLQQANMAISIVKKVGAPVNYFTHGTAYHTGPEAEDYEQIVADAFDAKIENEINVDVGGVVINAMHHVSTTQNVNTRNNGLGKAAADLTYRVGRGDLVRLPDLAFRGHRHYYGRSDDGEVDVIGLPALQFTNGAKWARSFTIPQTFGFCVVEVEEGEYQVILRQWKSVSVESELVELVNRASDEEREAVMEILRSSKPYTEGAVPRDGLLMKFREGR